MILTTAPQALPGSCYQCGSASRDSYIDTGSSVEFHGAVYYCCECVAEMAALMGFLPPDRVQGLELKIEILEQELFEAQRKAAGYERALDGLRFAGHDVPNPPPVGVGIVEAPEPSDAGASEREDSVAGGEGTAAEPSDDAFLAGLRTSDGLDGSPVEFSLDL